MKRIAISIAMLAAFALAPCRGVAQGDANALTRGFALVQKDCGACHAIGPSDKSPHRISPPLRTLHERYPIAMLSMARKTGSIAGHDEMPGFDYGPSDIRAVLLYIDSLSPIGKHYMSAP